MSEPVFQSSLGRKVDNSIQSERSWSMGYLAFGRVMKVHHKRMTADVQLMDTNETIMSSPENEGMYSCKIGVSNAGYDEDIQLPYGVIRPLHVGEIVLVAFLRQNKCTPVVLSSFHLSEDEIGQSSYSNILSSIYPLTATQDMNRYVNISRIQDFINIDGAGNTEISSHTKSFMVATHENISDDFNGLDYENLHIKDKTSKKTVTPPKAYWSPLNLLGIFRDKFEDEATSWLKLFVNAGKTIFRLTKMQIDLKLSMLEITEQGDIVVRRQLDSNQLHQGQVYTECKIGQDGVIDIIVRGEADGNGESGEKDNSQTDNITTMNITGSTILVTTKSQIKMESRGDITLNTKDTMNVNSTGTTTVNTTSNTTITTGGNTTISTSGDTNVSSSGAVNISGTPINLTSGGRIDLSCSAGYINGKRIIVVGDRDTDGDRML